MGRAFKYRVGIRNTGWICLAGFVGMAAFSVLGALDAPVDRRSIALIVFEGFWSFWIGMAIWMLMAYYKGSLCLSDDRIVRHGMLGTRAIEFTDVIDMKWRMWPVGGSIVLKTDDARMAFDFQNFDPADRVTMIRSLRSAVPESIQRGWPEFCERWAAPLLERDENRPLREGEVRITRDLYDVLFLPTIGVASVVGIALALWLADIRFVLMPIPLIAFWLMFRSMTPRQGYIARKLSSDIRTTRHLFISATIGVVSLLAIWWIDAHAGRFQNPSLVMIIVAGLAMVAVIMSAALDDRREKRRLEPGSSDAVRRWESAVQIEQPIIR